MSLFSDKLIIIIIGLQLWKRESSLPTSPFPLREAQLEKAVTSIALGGEGQQFFVGTEAAQMYGFRGEDFRAELVSSSHRSAVKDVAICL